MPKISCLMVCILFATVAAPAAAQAPPQDRQREIQHIAGDLYRFQNMPHYTVFLVTSEGIILADPINTEAATWLKGELERQFDVPVRYVLYSHHHFDHASGGDVFADTAEFVGHSNMPVNLAKMGDDPRYGQVRAPDRVFSDRTSVSLGGKTVELIHALPSHSDDSVIMIFPEERAAFGVDWINIRRLPFSRYAIPITGFIKTVAQLEALDFDIMVPGHGAMGSKTDVREYRGYLETLVSEVSKGIAAGETVEHLQRRLTLDEYQEWESFDAWREENILRTYEHLTASSDSESH